MSSASLIDHYQSHENFDKINSIHHDHPTSNNHDEYKQKLLEKFENDQQNGNSSFLNTLEELRHEQRVRLAQVEHDYYNQKATSSSSSLSDIPEKERKKQETLIISKPPLPKASKQSSLPVFLTEERAQYHMHHHHPISTNVVRRHDNEIAFCPHRTTIGDTTTTVHDLTTNHVKNQIQSMWNEFQLEDYLDNKKTRRSPASASWAGRITIPEPFALTNSINMDSVHRTKCMREIFSAKIQKEVDDELSLSHSFKANPIPNHVSMPLYEKLQEEQRIRSEQIRQMTRDYLKSIQKPFGFDSREKAKKILRRHSYSGGDIVHPEPKFKAKPLPNFYYQSNQENEEMKEKSLYRSLRKEMRAKQLLRQSRLPFSTQKPKFSRRSMSVNDLARSNFQEYSFKPKINGYYVPNYDKLHAKFLRNMEQTKRTRSPTKCKPFLLYTNLIPSKKDKILDDIRNDEHIRHSQTFQIKGKQMPIKSASIMSLSASFQQAEAIPTKTTEAQRLREAVGKKKRRQEEGKTKFQESFQRSKSAKERRVREQIRERAALHDKAVVSKAQREDNSRKMRQQLRQTENDYAKNLDDMNQRIQQRPLLLEQKDPRQKAVQELEKKFQNAMKIANVTEQDLIQKQSNTY